MIDGPMRIRDMPAEAFGELLRALGPEIGTLAKRGDKLATAVMAKYQYAHDHPTDAQAILEVRVALEDYVNRDLRLGELYDLGSKFGHRVNGS